MAGDEAASPPKTPTESTSRRRSPLLPSLVCSPSPSCYLDELLPLCFLPVMFTQQLCEETTQGACISMGMGGQRPGFPCVSVLQLAELSGHQDIYEVSWAPWFPHA